MSLEEELAFLDMAGEDSFNPTTPPVQSRPLTPAEIAQQAQEELEERRFGHQALLVNNPHLPFREVARHLLHTISPHYLRNIARNLIATHLIERKMKKIDRQARAAR